MSLESSFLEQILETLKLGDKILRLAIISSNVLGF